MDIHHGMNPWKSDGVTPTTTKFGHADYHAAKAQGKSDAEIASWAKSNTDLMGNKGVGGDLWNTIMAAAKSAKPAGGGGGGGGGGGYTAPTHDQELSYEGYNNPGDNPYTSNYTPKQFGYTNDLSTLSLDELAYRRDNEQGYIDREISPENPYSLLNDYIFRIKDKINNQDELELKVGTIGRESDDESEENPYDKYRRASLSHGDEYDEYDSFRYY